MKSRHELQKDLRLFRATFFRQSKRLFIYISGFLLFIGCKTVNIPTKENDNAPVITITVNNRTNNTSKSYNADDIINVRRGTELQFIVIARNTSGGVKDLFLTLFDQVTGSKMHVGSTPDASGNVPVQLSIATQNNQQIKATYTDPGKNYTVHAEATNYNLSVTVVVLKIVVDPDPPSIIITDFKVQPAIVRPGENFTVSWNYDKKGNNLIADLLVTKKYFQEPELPVFQSLDAPLVGTTSLPSGPSGFPDFKLIVRYRNNPGIVAVSNLINRQIMAEGPNTPHTPYLVITGPNTDPSILYEKLPFTIAYEVVNAGNKESESLDVNLLIDGAIEGTAKTIPKLQAKQSITLQWSVTKELLGGIRSFDLLNVQSSGNLGHSQLMFSTK